MAELFRVMSAEYIAPFSTAHVTEGQQFCRDTLRKYIDTVLETKGRERFLQRLMNCVTGYAEEDQEELIDEGAFSQYQYYKPFAIDLVNYIDKFDFLTLCIHSWVCMVRPNRVELFLKILKDILQPEYSPIEQVLDGRQPETPRIYPENRPPTPEQDQQMLMFTTRTGWPVDSWRKELKELEEEQQQAEIDAKLREGPPVFDWKMGVTEPPEIEPKEGSKTD